MAEAALLLTAAIWGFAFVAQRRGMDHMGPFLFNALRFGLGCLPLLPFLARARFEPGDGMVAIRRGVVLGFLLFGGASLQQVGLVYTTVAKAGFITGLYVVLVPLLAWLFGTRIGWPAAGGASLAGLGMYLLTLHGGGSGGPRDAANLGDVLILICALFWAMHILAVGRWAGRLPWPHLAFSQFATCAVLSLGVAVVFEPIESAAIAAAWVSVLYAGLLSVGAGYTLQVVAQRHAPATPAAIILSLETVFAVVGGWWFLHEGMVAAGIVGCVMMLAGMILASLRRPPAA